MSLFAHFSESWSFFLLEPKASISVGVNMAVDMGLVMSPVCTKHSQGLMSFVKVLYLTVCCLLNITYVMANTK